jgi:hypothetical protein
MLYSNNDFLSKFQNNSCDDYSGISYFGGLSAKTTSATGIDGGLEVK